MSSRSVKYVFFRPKVWLPGLFGAGLVLGSVSLFWGIGLIGFAIFQASRLLRNPQLDDLLRLRAEKRKHGIRRLLNDRERREVIAIDDYCKDLTGSGADPALGADVREQAWQIVREKGRKDSSIELRVFREKLPRAAGGKDTPEQKLAARLERELNIVHATQKEMESLGSA